MASGYTLCATHRRRRSNGTATTRISPYICTPSHTTPPESTQTNCGQWSLFHPRTTDRHGWLLAGDSVRYRADVIRWCVRSRVWPRVWPVVLQPVNDTVSGSVARSVRKSKSVFR